MLENEFVGNWYAMYHTLLSSSFEGNHSVCSKVIATTPSFWLWHGIMMILCHSDNNNKRFVVACRILVKCLSLYFIPIITNMMTGQSYEENVKSSARVTRFAPDT